MKTIRFIPLAVAAAMMALSAPVSASLDGRIEASARKSYVFKTFLKADDISIDSKDGVVVLTGTVAEVSHKSLAQETLAELPGVKSVENKLEVKGEPTANSDAWLSDKLKITLLFHRSVSAGKTEVEVKDGMVTLRGVAENQAQKELTTEYASDIDGVKGVKNEMTLAETPENRGRTTGEKIDDSSISAQVRLALLFHRSTSVISTSVSTKRGVVTLGGKARNTAEKDLVTKLVEDIKGVKKVNNLITVE